MSISRVSKFSIFPGGRINGRGDLGRENCVGLFVKSFLPAFKEKTTQGHLFTSHKSACEVWVNSDILKNFTWGRGGGGGGGRLV